MSHHRLENRWRTDAELATPTRTRAPKMGTPTFSWTNQTIPDYGIYTGHRAGR